MNLTAWCKNHLSRFHDFHLYTLAPHLARLPLKALLGFDCEVILSHEKRTPIELHWAVAPDNYPFRFDADVMWRSRRTAHIAGQDVSVLAPECLLMYLCMHGAKHAWSRLIWFADVARLVDHGVDWQEALALATDTRCERPFFLGLR
jgi:putative nucleotidyltransferase-like protein